MQIIYFTVLLVCIVIIKKIFRNIYSPAFIITVIWALFPFGYELISRSIPGYNMISENFYIKLLLLFYIPSIIAVLVGTGPIIKLNNKYDDYDINNARKNYINKLVLFAIIINFLLIFRIVKWFGTTNIVVLINKFRIVTLYSPELFPLDVIILRYFFSLTPPLLIFIFLYRVPIKKYRLFVLLSETVLVILIYAAKAMLIKFVVIAFLLLLLRKKLNFKNVIILGILLIIALAFVTSSRDSAYVNKNNIVDYIFLYLLSAIPALDKLLGGIVVFSTDAFGSQTLGFFYRVGGKLFGSKVPAINEISTLIQTPRGDINTNVFTSVGMYYVDFGLIGILLYGIAVGFLFGWLYKKGFIQNKKFFLVYYVLEAYALVTQFFGDVFFSYLSMPIQDFAWTFIVAEPILIFSKEIHFKWRK